MCEVLKVRTRFLIKLICMGIAVSLMLSSGCTEKKSTSPAEPDFYLMKDYFPLNDGDEWTWEKEMVDSVVPEPFVDGDINLGEPFVDVNKNGRYDFGESYQDLNYNGKYDGPYDPWTPGVPYVDRNNNGEYDPPNGKWDEGESFVDLDSNGVWNCVQYSHVANLKAEMPGTTYVSSDGSIVFVRCSHLLGENGDSVDCYANDGFSIDSLGFRWHSHTDVCGFFWADYLRLYGPITIAWANIGMGDSAVSSDTVYFHDHPIRIYTWISVFEGVENVTVPAATFSNCMKFRSAASG